MIEVGSPAPDFSLPRDGGGTVTLSDLRGQKVALFFYPRDDTASCTLEAIDFTRLSPDFTDAGTVIIGLSKDSVAAHDRFCRKHGLGITLVSDEAGDTCERYGVWAAKKMYGREFMGIVRTTVLIGADGRIARIWPEVKVAGHADEVLAAARAL